MVTRNHRIPGARYFGPYPKIWAVRETIDLMIRAFPIRTCSDSSYARAMATGRPCFPGQIGRCGGPCSQKVTIEEHRVDRRPVRRVHGEPRPTDHRPARRRRCRRPRRRSTSSVPRCCATAFRRSRTCSRRAPSCSPRASTPTCSASSTTSSRRPCSSSSCAAVACAVCAAGSSTRSSTSRSASSSSRCSRAAYESEEPPQRDHRAGPAGRRERARDLARRACARGAVRSTSAPRSAATRPPCCETATLNAKQALMLYKTRRTADYVARTQALNDIQDALGLDEAPLRMECYDVSHLGGTNIVASMVVFEDGLPKKSAYRKFAVPGLRRRHRGDLPGAPAATRAPRRGRPDAARRGLSRRRRAAPPKKRFAYRPGLLIVDGGQPQVEAAAAHPRRARHRRHPGLRARQAARGDLAARAADFPVILPRNSEALFLHPAHPRRGAPVRDHLPAAEAPRRHRVGAGRGARARPGARQGAAASTSDRSPGSRPRQPTRSPRCAASGPALAAAIVARLGTATSTRPWTPRSSDTDE